jgi:hypothetical protein
VGGYVDRLRRKHTITGSGFPIGRAENNADPAIALAKLFGPIEIEG